MMQSMRNSRLARNVLRQQIERHHVARLLHGPFSNTLEHHPRSKQLARRKEGELQGVFT